MKEIINISLGSASENFDETISVLGTTFRIKRLGVDFNINLAKKLIEQYRNSVDLFALSGFPPIINLKSKTYIHCQLRQIIKATDGVPIIDGQALRDVYQPWFLDRLLQASPDFFDGKRVGFFTGCIQMNILKELEKHNCELRFADPYFFYRVPKTLKTSADLDLFLKSNIQILTRYRLRKLQLRDFTNPLAKKMPSFRKFLNSDIFIANSSQLDYVKLPRLDGKTFILEHLTKKNEEKLRAAGVERILTITKGNLDLPVLNLTLLQAIFQLLKDDLSPLTASEIIEFTDKLNLAPKINKAEQRNIEEDNKTHKFSFIVHPLSINHIFLHPALKPLGRNKGIKKATEKLITLAPGTYYGKVLGVKSEATGKEVVGEIYTILDTPKMMMKAKKECIYRKLVNITHQAKNRNSKIIGLGAYTKIVGDAGVTVAKRSPIPVTTGNSLSAASTLWAASYGIQKMNFVNKDDDIYQGTAMVVGATGSIGKVCSKLLSKFWENIIIVAPRPFKLVDLAKEIKKISPSCNITYSTSPDDHLQTADLVITTTSAQGRKILDIEEAKPGAVICDVSRPFDISLEDSLKRPDVLVIASGEVELPGNNVKLTCDIGLPGTTVYACLAETALLALEGRFENFSLSRDINYRKVIEIDSLARKHGVKLSAIMGHDSEITDDEIALCREHALRKRLEEEDNDELCL